MRTRAALPHTPRGPQRHMARYPERFPLKGLSGLHISLPHPLPISPGPDGSIPKEGAVSIPGEYATRARTAAHQPHVCLSALCVRALY